MIFAKRFYINIVLQSVIEDYNKKIKKLRLEEEYPCEYKRINNKFQHKVKTLLFYSKYNELILKIKEYEELVRLFH